MSKKFDAKKIAEQIVIGGCSKFFLTEANEVYMEYGPQPEKGAFPLLASNMDPIILSAAKMPLALGQKEVVRQLIVDKAKQLATKQQVFNRVGFKDGNIYLDRGADGITKVTADAIIKKLKKSSVPFRRNKTIKELPAPALSAKTSIKDGLKKLKRLINVTEPEFMLVVAWLMSIFISRGTKPILILEGQQGSAKSTTMVNLLRTVDPHQPPFVSLSNNEKDLFIHCQNRALAGFDNVSDMKNTVSDSLCKILSGSGVTSRKLYTDGDEHNIYAHTPIILNGITTNAVRGDLLDRAIKIEAPYLEPKYRQTETDLEEEFQKYHPIILGALLRMAQYGLANPRKLPPELRGSRLADFCEWTYSWAPATGENSETLIEKIIQNQRMSKLEVLNADTVTAIILELLEENNGKWKGLSANLFHEFRIVVEARQHWGKLKNLPQSPQALTTWLRRSTPSLKAAGISIADKHTRKGTWYTISNRK